MSRPSSAEVERWVLRRHVRPGARLRLLCLPHAGGDTWIFRDWQGVLPPNVEVCPVRLPGRGSRMAEPPISDIDALVSALADGVAGLLDRPFAIFGHSMGALVGVALARRLERERGLGAALLCVAACRAPDRARFQPTISHLPPELLLDALQARFGHRQSFDGDAELTRLLLPTLRADLALCEGFAEPGCDPLRCPIVAYGGDRDPTVDLSALRGWADHTTGAFRHHVLEGGHFFPVDDQSAFLPVLAGDLTWASS